MMWRSGGRGFRVYQKLSGRVQHNGIYYSYEGRERDYQVLGYTPEQNKALGHIFELKLLKYGLVGASSNLPGAERMLIKILELYFDRRDRKPYVNWSMWDKNKAMWNK